MCLRPVLPSLIQIQSPPSSSEEIIFQQTPYELDLQGVVSNLTDVLLTFYPAVGEPARCSRQRDFRALMAAKTFPVHSIFKIEETMYIIIGPAWEC